MCPAVAWLQHINKPSGSGSPLVTIASPDTRDNSLVFISFGTSKLYFSIAMSNISSLFPKPVSFSSPAGERFPRKIPRVSKA